VGLFGKKKGLVGVDIGSSAVKAVELKVGGKGGDEYQLLNIGIEPLPAEAIVDGQIMDSGAVIDAIQRVFQESKIKTGEVATGVSGNAVIVKKISLPQMSARSCRSRSTGRRSSTSRSTSRTWPSTTRSSRAAARAGTWTCSSSR
jgi:Tfp pilus assembly PilM family ATPase